MWGPFFMTKRRKIINIIAQVAIFGGLAAILYCVPGLYFSLPVAPSFMTIHLDEIPILISGFAYGPIVALLELLLKTGIKLMTGSITGCVGELGDLMYSLALIIPATWIYQKHRNIKGAILGVGIGVFANLIFTTIVNLYTIFPVYKVAFSMKDGDIAGAFDAIYHWGVTSDEDIRIAVMLLPFNLIKDTIVVGVTFICYKPLRFVIEKINVTIPDKKKSEEVKLEEPKEVEENNEPKNE